MELRPPPRCRFAPLPRKLLPAPIFRSGRSLHRAAHHPLDARLGGILGVVGLGVLPPPALGGIPELALQLFRSSEKAAPEQFLRRGLDLFFRFFWTWCFFL